MPSWQIRDAWSDDINITGGRAEWIGKDNQRILLSIVQPVRSSGNKEKEREACRAAEAKPTAKASAINCRRSAGPASSREPGCCACCRCRESKKSIQRPPWHLFALRKQIVSGYLSSNPGIFRERCVNTGFAKLTFCLLKCRLFPFLFFSFLFTSLDYLFLDKFYLYQNILLCEL